MPKSLEDIIPPSRRRMMAMESQKHEESVPFAQAPTSTHMPSELPSAAPAIPPAPPRVYIRTGRSFPYGTAIIAVLVIALSAGALYVFAGAKVVIIPTSQTVSLTNEAFQATANTGDLPFTVETITKTASAYVPAESTETANNSAQGTIVVSNAQTSAQSLITNTRFETPTGLIFRIHAPITIPAASTSGPGTLSVTVYADQPGQQYNVGPTTFTVPGLQGSSSYTLVTAKSSSPMQGGFTGTRASVSQTTDTNEQNSLQESLSSMLQTDLANQIPAGYVLVPGSSQVTYQANPDSATTTTSVLVSEQGTITAVVFPEDSLAKAIAEKEIGDYSGVPVTLQNVSKLEYATSNANSSSSASADLSSATNLTFTLSGSATVIWKVDASKIAGAVAGKTRDSAQNILSSFPEVSQAVLTLRPFWANAFPQDPSHIQVIVQNPAAGS